MARRSEGLISLAARLPWWGALLLGGVFYTLLAHVMPMALVGPLAKALEPAFRMLGYFLAAACLLGAVLRLGTRLKQKLLFDGQRSLNEIRSLNWSDFEHLIAEAFRREGFVSNLTDSGPDGGVDLVLTRERERWFVQCKQWRTRRVGVKTVRELAGVISAAGVAGGIVVCSGGYTASARAFARQAGIRLIDGAALSKMVVPGQTTSSPGGTSSDCPSCGSQLVRRIARQGQRSGLLFYGCSGFPKCRYTRDA
jgi:restriction system protein